MAETERTGPPHESRPGNTNTRSVAPADAPTPAQRWAAAWLAAPHDNDRDCAACTAGWALIGGTP